MNLLQRLKDRKPAIIKEALLVLVLCVASLLVAIVVSGVLDRGWRTPIQHHEDSLYHYLVAQSVLDDPFLGSTERLNTPFGHTHAWYPIAGETITWGSIVIGGLFTNDVVLLMNLYFLFSFPASLLAAYLVFRATGFSMISSAAAAVLFAFLPEHWYRGQRHIAFISLWCIATFMLHFVWIAQGKLRWKSWKPKQWTWRHGVALISLPLLAWSSTYFFVIGMITFSLAALLFWNAKDQWHKLWSWAVSAGLAILLLVVAFIPVLSERAQWSGPEPTSMTLDTSLGFTRGHALDIVGLFFPAYGHPVQAFEDISHRIVYGGISRLEFNWIGSGMAFGLVVIALVGAFLLSRSSSGRSVVPTLFKDVPRSKELNTVARMLPVITVVAILLSVASGFLEILTSIYPPFRVWNRSGFFIGFFGATGLALAVEWAWHKLKSMSVMRWVFVVVVGALVSFGVYEQSHFFKDDPSVAEIGVSATSEDIAMYRDYFQHIEQQYIDASEVDILQLPHRGFPRGGYDLTWPYLFTEQMRLSWGGMRYTQAAWKDVLYDMPAERLPLLVSAMEYDAILLDHVMISTDMRDQLQSIFGIDPQVSEDSAQRFSFFDLPVAQAEELSYVDASSEELARMRRLASSPLVMNVRDGWYKSAVTNFGLAKPDAGVLSVWNLRPRPVTTTLDLVARHAALSLPEEPGAVVVTQYSDTPAQLAGEQIASHEITGEIQTLTTEITFPPGETWITIKMNETHEDQKLREMLLDYITLNQDQLGYTARASR